MPSLMTQVGLHVAPSVQKRCNILTQADVLIVNFSLSTPPTVIWYLHLSLQLNTGNSAKKCITALHCANRCIQYMCYLHVCCTAQVTYYIITKATTLNRNISLLAVIIRYSIVYTFLITFFNVSLVLSLPCTGSICSRFYCILVILLNDCTVH